MESNRHREDTMTTQHIKNRLESGEYDLLLAELRDWQARTKLMYATVQGYIDLVCELQARTEDNS
jgi:hypothetical protein